MKLVVLLFLLGMSQGQAGPLFNLLSGKLAKSAQPDQLFYFPTSDPDFTPKKWKMEFEDVRFPSSDGTMLHGWFLPNRRTKKPAKGTVVYHHGNQGAIAYHLGLVYWLMDAGYHVLLYDYRGFGSSEGELNRAGMVADARAAVLYGMARKESKELPVFSFGHSLGGAKSLAALGKDPVPGLRGVICFGGFSSYQKIATDIAGALGKKVIPDELSPIQYVDKIAPIPLLIVHGTNDKIVPFPHGKALFVAAREPKTFIEIKDGDHVRALIDHDFKFAKKVLIWMDQQLKKPVPVAK